MLSRSVSAKLSITSIAIKSTPNRLMDLQSESELKPPLGRKPWAAIFVMRGSHVEGHWKCFIFSIGDALNSILMETLIYSSHEYSQIQKRTVS
ncbi:hypothetical protein TNCT_338981 [Trichonephila clavata]|uniref:Uncharacterized protein n=1 Tax=Trichonephila clavata TaxID=2740835 RepID=A0A8X6HX30_TRICU|nr:hypothetical protein TNCT_338981 [Trichonephila clavata]